jgi:hypothetical protein
MDHVLYEDIARWLPVSTRRVTGLFQAVADEFSIETLSFSVEDVTRPGD